MAEATQTSAVNAPLGKVWQFVRDMNHWAPLMPGYVSHQQTDEVQSRWKIRGDVGPFSRVVDFAVTVTEWREPAPDAVVRFHLKGLNELVEGSGSLTLIAAEGDVIVSDAAKVGWFYRLYLALFRLVSPFGKRAAPLSPPIAVPSDGQTLMTLRLELIPGGPMGGVVDKMIGPLLPQEAAGLAARISERIESST